MKEQHLHPSNEAYKYKEQLYSLFFEIAGKVKGWKMGINKEQYINNIKSTKLPQLINYLKEMINILIQQQSQEFNNKIYTKRINVSEDEANKYEQMLHHYELNERRLIQRNYLLTTIRDIHENRLKQYYQMEKEFIEMKTKAKYEENRFFREERKENEVIIIRTENAILKKTIAELEGKCDKKDQEIKELMGDLNKEVPLIKNDDNINANGQIIGLKKNSKSNLSYDENRQDTSDKTLLNQFNKRQRQKMSKSLPYGANITLNALNKEPSLSSKNKCNKLNCSMNKIDIPQRNLLQNSNSSKQNYQLEVKLYSVRANNPYNKQQQQQKVITSRTSKYNKNCFITRRSGIYLSRLVLSKSLSGIGPNLSFLNKSNSKGDIDQH